MSETNHRNCTPVPTSAAGAELTNDGWDLEDDDASESAAVGSDGHKHGIDMVKT